MLAKPMLIRLLPAALALLAFAGSASADDPRRDEQWGLAMVEGPEAWGTSTGVGAIVAVIDSGVRVNHPDLSGRLLPGKDYAGKSVDERGDERDQPSDKDGHGTHVSGIVAANRDNGEGVTGVAPDARVLPLRVIDDSGGAYTEQIVSAMDDAIAQGAHVINLSLGSEVPLAGEIFDDPAFKDAVKRATVKDVVVVFAAGNNAVPACENPRFPDTLCVGAVDRRRNRSVFSNFGEGVHLMAPGGSLLGGSSEDVLSTYTEPDYESIAGTSMAAPHVAGVAALLASLGVRGAAAVERIISTATDAGMPGPDDTYGAGILNAKAAVAGLGAPPPPGPEPGPEPTPRGSFSTKSVVTVRAVKKKGVRVSCKAVRPGTCAVRVTRHGRTIASGRGDVPAGSPATVVARLNKHGRKIVDRIKTRFRVGVLVTLPGESARNRTISIKR